MDIILPLSEIPPDLLEFFEPVNDWTAPMTDVLKIAAEPLKAAHYAAFPTALVSNCLRAGTSSRGYCRACGAPWCRVVERIGGPPQGDHNNKRDNSEFSEAAGGARMMYGGNLSSIYAEYGMPQTKTLDWRPSCSCDAGEPRPGKVLDCFAGSGRTGLEAQRLGLDFTGIELHPDYASLSQRLLREDMPLFNREDAPAAGQESES